MCTSYFMHSCLYQTLTICFAAPGNPGFWPCVLPMMVTKGAGTGAGEGEGEAGEGEAGAGVGEGGGDRRDTSTMTPVITVQEGIIRTEGSTIRIVTEKWMTVQGVSAE